MWFILLCFENEDGMFLGKFNLKGYVWFFVLSILLLFGFVGIKFK